MDFKQGLRLHIGQRLEQRLVMTQQLQQAIRLLQLSRTELVEQVRETLNENPLLEEQGTHDGASSSTSVTGGEGEVTSLDSREGAEKERQEIDWQEYFADLASGPSASTGSYRSRDDELPTLDQTLSREATLSEVLHEQLAGMAPDKVDIANEVIGNLDDDGYFRPSRLELRGGSDAGRRLLKRKAEQRGIETEDLRGNLGLLWLTDEELEEWTAEGEARGMKATVVVGNSTRAIAKTFNVTLEVVNEVLEVLQRCEPIGVASRDLRECLLTQAMLEHPDEPKLHRLIDRHLGNLEKRKNAPILRDLKLKSDEVKRLVTLLQTLEPRPGRRYSGGSARYITPDVYVHKVGKDYTVVVNDNGLPKLRVSNFYKHALAGGKGEDKQAKDYLQEKMRQAVWMIRSIQQRQNTIQKVTESIMRHQHAFLEQGVAHLRPLVLRQVADDVGLHESTVSRVTTAKYVHTPQGIYELKYFFNSRIQTRSGHDMASEAVKFAIGKLIDHEFGKSPLSDQELAEILQGKWDRGKLLSRLDTEEAELSAVLPEKRMNIARRTVAKYREAMNIASSSRRRAMF